MEEAEIGDMRIEGGGNGGHEDGRERRWGILRDMRIGDSWRLLEREMGDVKMERRRTCEIKSWWE